MIVNGIIAEYNPFHNGHALHIQKSKEMTNADYTIVAMSGNFVQRGAPAIIDKYTRAKMALMNSADLVLEIPTFYAASSAEFFGGGAVTLLDKLGVVNYLSFGSECGSIPQIEKIAKILADEPEEFSEMLKRYLRDGDSFPVARNKALIQYDSSLYDSGKVLENPNNILGVEYLKAIIRRNSSIVPITIKRMDSNYHDRYFSASANTASAQAVREALLSNPIGDVKSVVPDNVYSLIENEINSGSLIDINDFSAMLFYKLIDEKPNGYSKYLDVSEELSDRIINNLNSFTSISQFADLLKTRDRTYTRISRSLMHILLGIHEASFAKYEFVDHVPYARVLGFKKQAEPLLTEIKLHSSIPMVTNLADSLNNLYEEPLSMLKKEVRANSIYLAAKALKTGVAEKSELSTPIVIV